MSRLERKLRGSTLCISWLDCRGGAHRVEATFDIDWLDDIASRRLFVDWSEIAGRVETLACDWTNTCGFCVTVSVNRDKSGLEFCFEGSRLPGKEEINAHMDEYTTLALREQGFFTEQATGIAPDIRPAAIRAAPFLSPLARALRSDSAFLGASQYVSRALSFVQHIPYVANSEDFLLPAGVLFADRGDCDEKAALLLGLYWTVYPRQPVLEVRIPQHLIIGLCDLDSPSTISALGRNWAGCEAAGPAQVPLGEVSPDMASALQAGAARIRELRFGEP